MRTDEKQCLSMKTVLTQSERGTEEDMMRLDREMVSSDVDVSRLLLVSSFIHGTLQMYYVDEDYPAGPEIQ